MISHAPASLIESKPSRTPDAGPPPRFSVIIPAFNYGRFLGAAIDSALAQRGPTFEVIVVDDGSTDETPQVMARYGGRIAAMRQPNAGPFAACRAAFEAARGDWITVFDADDRLAPGALEALARAIDASPGCGVAVGPWRSVDAQGRERDDPFVPPRGERLADFDAFIRGRMRFVTGAAAIRRTALSVFYGFRRLLPRGMETIVFAHLLLRERFAVADRPLLLVHDHPGRLRERQHEHGITTADSVDVMFDSSMIDAEAARRRPLFEAWLLRERARLLYRQRRPREALAAFARAVRRDPRSLLDLRNARRALVSAAACLAVADPPPEPGRRDVALRLPHPRRQRADFLADPLGFIRRAGSLADAVICSAPTPTCVLFHPDDARHVLVTQARRYAKTGFIDTWRRYLRRSIISSEPPEHTDHRRALSPFFQPGAVAWLGAPAVRMLDQAADAWRPGEPVNVFPTILAAVQRLTMLMVSGSDEPDLAQELFDLSVKTHAGAVRMHRCPVRLPDTFPLHHRNVYRRTVDRIERRLTDLIARRRAATDTGELDPAAPPPADALGFMLRLQRQRPEVFTDALIADQLKILLPAATEPIVTPTVAAIWRLADRPDWADRLAAEAVAGGADRPLALRFWLETLRHHPSNWMQVRIAIEDDETPGGLHISRGRTVAVSQYALHFDPRWFPEPDRFDPDRFTPERSAERPRHAFMPFGLGPRSCIGSSMAETVSVALISRLAERWRFDALGRPAPVMISPNGVIAQIRDLDVTVAPRPR